jgi:hypothetical protein
MTARAPILIGLTVLGLLAGLGSTVNDAPAGTRLASQSGPHMVLEDFRSPEADGLPAGWKAQRSEAKAKQAYAVQSEGEQAFLAVRHADQRVYKRIAWDPRALPIVTWRWRLKAAAVTGGKNQPPPSPEHDLIAAVFVSLDTDLMVIPVATKYIWSATRAKGTTTEGGLFGASEIVLRTGGHPIGKWIEERVNAYEDFKRVHKHEPSAKAWGISLLGGPGVEIDFGPITVSAAPAP